MKKKILILFILFFLLQTTFSQTDTQSGDNSNNNSTSDSIKKNWREINNEFYLKILVKEIINSDFYQLKMRAKSLGLPDYDNAQAYRNAIAEKLGVKLIDEEKKESQPVKNRIFLEKGGELKLIRLEEYNQENIQIIGETKLKIETEENGKKETKEIYADKIYIDIKNSELSGIGNVKYIDSTLEFEGEQFYYNYNVNRGALLNGRTKIKQKDKAGLEGAYFIGERIHYLGEEESILENGKITTCNEEDPHYSIKVSKIWLNKDSEWGLMDGTVYIGPIAFLYFPVYYHPKNIKIYPSLGYRNREGWYFQTTYAILGKIDSLDSGTNQSNNLQDAGVNKRRTPNSKEFFTITKADIEKSLINFYDSKEFYKKNPQFRLIPPINKIDLSLKIFFDGYYNLGFYWGLFFYNKLDNDIVPFELSILSDYSFSRRLWKDTKTSLYIFYDPQDKTKTMTGDSAKDFINTYFYPENNPFFLRTSQFAIFKGNAGNNNFINLNFETQLEYVTDGTFYQDFYSRNYTFAYLDLLASALKYSVESNSGTSSIFTKSETVNREKKSVLNNIFSFNLTPKIFPDIYGYKPINSFEVQTKTSLNLIPQNIVKYSPSTLNNGEDPRYERFFIDNSEIPSGTVRISGNIIDYDVIKDIPKKYEDSKKQKQNQKKTLDLKDIEELTKEDAKKSQKTIDYKKFIFFNLKFPEERQNFNLDQKDENFVFYTENENKKISEKDNENIEDSNKEDSNKNQDSAKQKGEKNSIETTNEKKQYISSENSNQGNSNQKENIIFLEMNKPISTQDNTKLFQISLNYSISDMINNKLIFNTKFKRENEELDNIQEIFLNKFEIEKRLMRFNFDNNFNLTINGKIGLFKIFSNSNELLSFSPNFNVKYRKTFDDMEIFDRYLAIREDLQTTKDKDRWNLITSNRTNSQLTITYSDNIQTDLSFNNQYLKGSGIATTLNTVIYDFNEQKSYDFSVLNEINTKLNNINYEVVDQNNYFSRYFYNEIVRDFYSVFTLKFNFFPDNKTHFMSISSGPKINWIIPYSHISKLKDELWNEESNSVYYLWAQAQTVLPISRMDDVNRLQDSAKEYIYFRRNGKNLLNKIEAFYYYENLFEKTRNFRILFENISINYQYTYKNENFNVVDIQNNTVFNLINIGAFSDGNGGVLPLAIYPNNDFSIKFFNSIFSYRNSHIFNREFDNNYKNDPVKVKMSMMDEYNIITFTNTNEFSLQIPGNIFDIKLPNGNWLNFTSSTIFTYNKNKKWNINYKLNNFFLSNQSIKLGLIMDIITFTLNFKYFDYQDGGYKFEIDNGTIKLGYNITEIPPLFNNLIKLRFKPELNLQFTVKHKPYYNDSGVLQTFTQAYYDNNKLEFSFESEMIIGEGKDWETSFLFGSMSNNKKLYLYYDENNNISFIEDLLKSFNFFNENDRRISNFNLQRIFFSIKHKLHDWLLYFEYLGKPERDYSGKKIIWDNTFTFRITWNIDSKNQLIQLFNKTKVDNKYEKGRWLQPSMSLDIQ